MIKTNTIPLYTVSQERELAVAPSSDEPGEKGSTVLMGGRQREESLQDLHQQQNSHDANDFADKDLPLLYVFRDAVRTIYIFYILSENHLFFVTQYVHLGANKYCKVYSWEEKLSGDFKVFLAYIVGKHAGDNQKRYTLSGLGGKSSVDQRIIEPFGEEKKKIVLSNTISFVMCIFSPVNGIILVYISYIFFVPNWDLILNGSYSLGLLKIFLAKKNEEEYNLLQEENFAVVCPKALKEFLELATIKGDFKPKLREMTIAALKSEAVKYKRKYAVK